ncbi:MULTISPECIES: hypothetical protein [Photorhabdus]|nr:MULTISPECIES: hypothetical protein [Photorhabdus]
MTGIKEHITGYNDVVLGRKIDLGLYFDWTHYQQLLQERKE